MTTTSAPPSTLFDKLWDAHLVSPESDAVPAVLYIDLHLIHEVTSPQAFAELESRGLAPAAVGDLVATLVCRLGPRLGESAETALHGNRWWRRRNVDLPLLL